MPLPQAPPAPHPRLLRLRWVGLTGGATRFFPMLPQPPELASVISRLESVRVCAHGAVQIMDCRNGSVFTRRREGRVLTHVVHHPLCPERGMCLVPPLPRFQDLKQQVFSAILSKEEGSLSYLYLMSQYSRETIKSIMRVYMLQDGVWRMHTLATSQFNHPRMQPKPVLVGNNIYMASSFDDDIFVLDLTTSSFSSIQLPQGVKYYFYNTILSRADDASSVYLIHVPIKEFQLRIWLHKGGNWLLVDTICLHEMFANLGILDQTLDDEDIESLSICQVGDNAEFVFLRMCGRTLYLDVTRRTLREVFGFEIHPFVMIWPPTFPSLMDDPERNSM
uniref:Uncharacterized protein n=1 Tax=Avena sativa TaxID=4498 RepID=A0ACD5Z8R7_AVESA